MRLLAAALVLVSACVSTDAVTCSDGKLCPAGTKCVALTNPNPAAKDPNPEFCATPQQLSVCDGVADGMMCTDKSGTCYGGFCIAPPGCGNGWLDPGEVCDDNNNTSGDGCSADCTSLEVCGNGIVDPIKIVNNMPEPNEQCDDKGTLGRDGCSGSCQLEAPHWDTVGVLPMPPREAAASAYDSARDRIVLFGGVVTRDALTRVQLNLDDTWEWDGTAWRAMPSQFRPEKRSSAALAYDADLHRSVLFGGADGSGAFGDTWVWDGEQWTLVLGTGPSARSGHAMAYDPIRKQVILFGGVDSTGNNLADTWAWNGAWTKLSPSASPSARSAHAMAFDPVRGVIVMTGGTDASMTVGDTWEFDGTTWKQSPAVTPASLGFVSMAWDPGGKHVIVYTGDANVSEMYSWDGTTWTQIAATDPGPRFSTALATDGARGHVVLFGGHHDINSCGACTGNLGDTWIWDGTAWTSPTLADTAITAVVNPAAAFDPLHARLVVFGGSTDTSGTRSPETWAYEHGSWSMTTNTGPSARAGAAMAFDAANDRMILFGGNDTADKGDTWAFDGAAWTELFPTTVPAARSGHAMEYDAAAKRIVLYGGSSATYDTWEWNGSVWSRANDGTQAPHIDGPILVYDPIRGQVLLVGTDSSSTAYGVYAWDHAMAQWTLVTMDLPPARSSSGVAWNPARRALTMFGGVHTIQTDFSPVSIFRDDAWELQKDGWVPVPVESAPEVRAGHIVSTSNEGGILAFGGVDNTTILGDTWRLRWEGGGAYEQCATTVDLDGDGLAACKDSDCWATCTPMCPPGVTCDPSWPHCGDGKCNASLETCRNCPDDCGACTAYCGDGFCDAAETHATCPGDCP